MYKEIKEQTLEEKLKVAVIKYGLGNYVNTSYLLSKINITEEMNMHDIKIELRRYFSQFNKVLHINFNETVKGHKYDSVLADITYSLKSDFKTFYYFISTYDKDNIICLELIKVDSKYKFTEDNAILEQRLSDKEIKHAIKVIQENADIFPKNTHINLHWKDNEYDFDRRIEI